MILRLARGDIQIFRDFKRKLDNVRGQGVHNRKDSIVFGVGQKGGLPPPPPPQPSAIEAQRFTVRTINFAGNPLLLGCWAFGASGGPETAVQRIYGGHQVSQHIWAIRPAGKMALTYGSPATAVEWVEFFIPLPTQQYLVFTPLDATSKLPIWTKPRFS